MISDVIDRWLAPEQEEVTYSRALQPVPVRQLQTDQLIPHTGALDVSATQSLIGALQATMTPSQALRMPVVIPGVAKKKTDKFASPMLGRRDTTRRLRRSMIFSTFFAFLLISLFTFSPLNGSQNTIPGVSNIVSFVQAQQANWNSFTTPFTGQQAQSQAQITTVQAPNLDLPTSQYVDIARQDAINAGIPVQYFLNQIQAESGFNPDAVSPAGAVGIAQFEPATAAALGFNPYDPIAALQGAANYMASLSNTYNGDYAKALAAYNAGGGTVDQAVQEGGANWMDFLPAETQAYIAKITGI
jgi:hypothetical protein